MDTRNLVVGSRIEHGGYGAGVVTFVGKTYLGIAFDDGGEALIQRTALEKEEPLFVPRAPGRAMRRRRSGRIWKGDCGCRAISGWLSAVLSKSADIAAKAPLQPAPAR